MMVLVSSIAYCAFCCLIFLQGEVSEVLDGGVVGVGVDGVVSDLGLGPSVVKVLCCYFIYAIL